MTMDMRDDGPDAAYADPVLADLLAELRAVADEPAPSAGPELAALLAGAAPIAPARARRSRTASVVVIGLVSSGVLAGGVGAAAADELPDPVQRVVSRVINTLTPFEVPHPDHRVPAHHRPDDDATLPQAPADLDEDGDVTPSSPTGTSEQDESEEAQEAEETEEAEDARESGGSDERRDDDTTEDGDGRGSGDDSAAEGRSGERDGEVSSSGGGGSDGSGDAEESEGGGRSGGGGESSDGSGSGGDGSEDHGD